MLKYYIVVLIFGKVASFTGPILDHDACRNQAQFRYEEIIKKASERGVTSVQIDGKTATKNDLAVVCKTFLKDPEIVIDLSQIKQ